jgi:hypothetical protein
MPAQLALSWTFNANSPATGGFTAAGLRYWQLTFVPVGTVSACSISLDSSVGSGFTTGGIISSSTIGSCASATSYSNSSATTPAQFGQLTPSITGSGSVIIVLLGYLNNPAAAGSSSAAITSPLDGSGNVKVNCEAGCNGSNASVSATGSAVPASATYLGASNGGNIIGVTADNLGDLHMVIENTAPTQPAGLGALIEFQQAVTATATVLATNSSHAFCIQALPANALTVYVGGSAETTSTGYPLQPGQYVCPQLSNTNLVYVIASGTGSSVAVFGF